MTQNHQMQKMLKPVFVKCKNQFLLANAKNAKSNFCQQMQKMLKLVHVNTHSKC